MQKLSVILLGLLICSATLFSQSSILQKTVTVGIKEGTVGSILREIGTQGGFSFSYGQDISRERYVRLNSSRQTVEQFLDELFHGQVYYVEYGDKIILLQRPGLPDLYTLRGRVIDSETKEPIPGVTVYIPGSDPLVGTVSNRQGYFELEVSSEADRVKLSCVGYKTDQLSPPRKGDVSVELDPARQELSEVQIVYYKPARNAEVNHAVSIISSKKMTMNTSSSVEEILQGNAAGVHVVRNSGMPGASIQVKVRGMNSLVNCDPIYFLDGVYLQQSSLNALSPHDIESVEVLKDASGTSKYGASAGNGVVLLHTKKGVPGKLSVTFNYSFGHQQVWKTPDLLSSDEYIYWFNKFKPNDSTFREYTDIEGLVDENWMEEIFHGAKTEDYHFAVSGGNENSVFYISSGYYKQETIIDNMEMDRYSFKIGSDHTVSKRLKFGEEVSFAFLNLKGLKEGCFMNNLNNPVLGALQMLPMVDKDSIPPTWYFGNTSYSSIPNKDAEVSNNSRKNYSLFGNFYTQIELFKGFNYMTRFGLELYFQDNLSFLQWPSSVDQQCFVGSTYTIRDLAFNWKHVLEYSTVIADRHTLKALVEFEYGQVDHEWIPLTQISYDCRMNPLHDPEINWEEPFSTDFIHQAWSGQFEYAYRRKYQLSVNVRSEKIGYFDQFREFQNLQDVYPSFSLGWLFTDENAFHVPWISFGKLRFGMGKVGISPRINYSFFADMMCEAQYYYALPDYVNQLNTATTRRINEQLFWEPLRGINYGIDLGFLDNQLFFTVDYFNDLLRRGDPHPIDKPKYIISELEGLDNFRSSYLKSGGTLNKGYEGEISWRVNFHHLNMETGINLSHMKNEVVDTREKIQGTYNYIAVNIPGEAAGSFYGYKIERLFTEEDCDRHTGQAINQPYTINDNGDIVYAQPNARAGDYKFADINSDGIIDQDDKMILGNPYPDFTVGIYQSIQFRNFDFSYFLLGIWGNEIFNATKFWTYNPYGFCNWTSDIANTYRLPSENDEGFTNTDLHRVDAEDSNQNLTRVSDFYVENGSYLRLKNIQLGYTIPVRISQRAHIQKFRIWIGAKNLFTWTNYSGLDPEVGGWGIDCGIYPQPRVFLAGINLEF